MPWKKPCRRRPDKMKITPEKLFGELLISTHGNYGNFPDAPVFCDSRQLQPGSVFVAVKGTAIDGEKFIPDAIAAGVSAIIHTSDLVTYPPDILFCQVRDIRQAYALLCRRQNGQPDQELKIYAVTGTNGKTTSVYLLRHLLEFAGLNCGMFSTVEFDDGQNTIPATHTTPDPQTFYPLLRKMRQNGATCCAMEFSSHALAQKRLGDFAINGAIFTNLTGDHLDFHLDMENYYQAKKTLFTDLLIQGGIAAINIDDPAGCRLAGELAVERADLKIPTFGRSENAGWRISEEASDLTGCRFVLSNALQAFQVSFELPGTYNISNLAGVLTLLLCDGVAPDAINQALNEHLDIPGRLEKLVSPKGATVFVDFAHTDDALENVLRTLKPLCSGKMIAVFGCGGNRDKSKRPRMGAAAAKWADKLIVTSDNPRNEAPENIIADIVAGIPQHTDFEVIVSRKDALAKAVDIAKEKDLVLVAGKGHENYQEINGVKHHFDDRETIKDLFAQIRAAKLLVYLKDFYSPSEYPALHAQFQKFNSLKPFSGLKVLDATPVFRNTMLKYAVLLAGGADLTVAVGRDIPCDPDIVKLLDSFGIRVADEKILQETFDLVADCAGRHIQVKSRYGYAELTRSGLEYYRDCSRPVFSVDSGVLKHFETTCGTGESFVRAMKKLGFNDLQDKSIVIFGGGKVGKGTAYYAAAAGAKVVIVDKNQIVPPENVSFVDAANHDAVAALLQNCRCVVSATGLPGVLAEYVPLLLEYRPLIANMGVEDEFGKALPDDLVLNRKRPLNFMLEEPTEIRYIDPSMALSNEALRILAAETLPAGINLPPADVEQMIINDMRKSGTMNKEIDFILKGKIL